MMLVYILIVMIVVFMVLNIYFLIKLHNIEKSTYNIMKFYESILVLKYGTNKQFSQEDQNK